MTPNHIIRVVVSIIMVCSSGYISVCGLLLVLLHVGEPISSQVLQELLVGSVRLNTSTNTFTSLMKLITSNEICTIMLCNSFIFHQIHSETTKLSCYTCRQLKVLKQPVHCSAQCLPSVPWGLMYLTSFQEQVL